MIKKEKKIYDLIVVGGGASGLIASGRAGELGLSVLLLEKNKRLGEKLRITGGGRCNITNDEKDNKIFLKKFGKAEQFLYSLFSQFNVENTFSFFEKLNLPLVTQEYKRVFPITENANDVVAVLSSYIKKSNVKVLTNSPVTKVESKDDIIVSVFSGKQEYKAKDFLFATGSISHPETGSTGDGFKWLEKLGHTIIKPTPSVVPIRVKESWVKELSGLTLEQAKISFFVNGKKNFILKGRILFTHFGLSGPLILNSASRVADLLHIGPVSAFIDIYPLIDIPILEKNIIKIFDENKNKVFKNIIKEIVPEGMHKGISTLLAGKIDLEKKIHSITKEERRIIVHDLKALPLSIEGLMGFDRAVLADGGLDLKEIDFKTMRSKKVKNLFVTGDLLNINRPSGGYSLQLCWSSGYVAGSHIGK